MTAHRAASPAGGRDPTTASAAGRVAGEDASIVLLGGCGLVVALALLIVTLDATAYLTAASRAHALADAAALAAATVSHPHGEPGDPHTEAGRVAVAGGGRLLACGCPPGATIVEVEVSVAVPAVVITRHAARRVAATARASLVPPARTPP